jgi:CTP:molybdopterin cytidylyltransferase MocA
LIAAVVLSAGKSERMGSPKALLRFGGRTFLGRILDAIGQSRIAETVVVVGHHRDAIQAAAPSLSIVYNPNYEQGMSTSVQAGLRALPAGVTGAAVFLVDHPLIDSTTIDALIEKLQPGHIVLPVHNGRRGHPVVFAADLFEEILQLSPAQGLNTVVRRDSRRIIEAPVKASGILVDIDTPDQFAKLLAESDNGGMVDS